MGGDFDFGGGVSSYPRVTSQVYAISLCSNSRIFGFKICEDVQVDKSYSKTFLAAVSGFIGKKSPDVKNATKIDFASEKIIGGLTADSQPPPPSSYLNPTFWENVSSFALAI